MKLKVCSRCKKQFLSNGNEKRVSFDCRRAMDIIGYEQLCGECLSALDHALK